MVRLLGNFISLSVFKFFFTLINANILNYKEKFEGILSMITYRVVF